MKICRIRDEYIDGSGEVGYLFYFENSHRFYIEIADGLDFWSAPPILDWYVERGIDYVDADWSIRWVKSRIIPPDRQNIGQILKNQGMDSYDEYRLLVYADGRCAQDECMVEEVREEDLPESILRRRDYHVQTVIPIGNNRVIVWFNDGISRICDVKKIVGKNSSYSKLLRDESLFFSVQVSEGGYGIRWDDEREIPYYKLREGSVEFLLSYHDLQLIIERETFDTAQTAERLNCTRQNIDDLVRRGKLHPVKTGAKNKLFMRSEVNERLW